MEILKLKDLLNISLDYAVIGFPIAHSLSPFIHNSLTGSENYISILMSPAELSEAIPYLKRLKGFNCTIPHKQAIMNYIDELSISASEYGAVNTVKVVDGKLYGHNTDGQGFLDALKHHNLKLSLSNVLISGSGGVARVMAYETIKASSTLTIYSRSTDKAEELKKSILKRYPFADIRVVERLGREKYNLFLNATPLGMYPDIHSSPLTIDELHNMGAVFDTVYNPYTTRLVKEARGMDINAYNGLYMLIAQAVCARYIWEGESYEEVIINNIASSIRQMQEEAK